MSERPKITYTAACENPPDVVVGEYVYVRKGLLDAQTLRERYELALFNEAQCGRCENRSYRPNEVCETAGPEGASCPAYHGTFLFSREKWLRDRASGALTDIGYDALPLADIAWIKAAVRRLPEYASLRSERIFQLHPMRYPLRFTGTLFGADAVDSNGYPRANQEEIAAEWLRHRVGGIKAPPRTGKTVLATYLCCTLGVKTVIIAHQYKLLKQFYDTFMGNPSPDNQAKARVAMTNAPALEKRYGTGSVIHLLKNAKHLERFGTDPAAWPDILLVTVQKFTRQLARIIDHINPHYSFKIVDEYHQAGAHAYARALFRMRQPYSLGLSATPQRKDEFDRKSIFTVGPVVAESQTISIPPIIEAHFVQALPDNDYKFWPYAAKWARGSPERNKEIVDEIFKDLAAGHDGIIVPVGKKTQQRYLCEAVNRRIKALKAWGHGWENWPYPLAVELHGDLSDAQKDAIIARMDDGRPCVMLAQMQMIKQGIDMEVPSMVYLTEPLSATRGRDVGAPMFYQLSFRVATPSPLKPMDPVVKIWVDNLSCFRGALNTLFYNEIVPGAAPDATATGPKYRLSKTTRATLSNLKQEKRKGGEHGRRGKRNSEFRPQRATPYGGSWTGHAGGASRGPR